MTAFPSRLVLRSPGATGDILVTAGAAAGLLWNAYGVVQFARTAGATVGDLESLGMTAAQAALYAALPWWMTAAFLAGVAGGALGSVLLVLRHRAAGPVLTASLAGYLVLFAGDVALGVFAAFGPPQVLVIAATVVVAAVLLVLARRRSGGVR